jgi:hypothetical protein
MTFRSCPHESEIRALLERGQWSHASTSELRAHAANCRACGDLVLVTHAFRGARATSVTAAKLNAPGVVWWRAQLRRRNAAVERMSKPILGAHIFALAITLLTAVGLVISQAKHGLRWLSWFGDARFGDTQPSNGFHLDSLWSAATVTSMIPDWNLTLLIPALAMLALLGGVVLYLATEKQ